MFAHTLPVVYLRNESFSRRQDISSVTAVFQNAYFSVVADFVYHKTIAKKFETRSIESKLEFSYDNFVQA